MGGTYGKARGDDGCCHQLPGESSKRTDQAAFEVITQVTVFVFANEVVVYVALFVPTNVEPTFH